MIWILSDTFVCLHDSLPQPGIMMLRDRLFHAQGEAAVGQQTPNSFNRVSVSTAKSTPAAQTPAPKAQVMACICCFSRLSFLFNSECLNSLKIESFFCLQPIRVSTSLLFLRNSSLHCHQFLPHKLLQPTWGLVCNLLLM